MTSSAGRARRGRRAQRSAPEALPRLVRQVAALLSAGRTGPILWGALGQVLAVELSGRRTPGGTAAQLSQRGPGYQDGARAGPESTGNDATLRLIFAVERASALGLPTAVAVRSACHVLGTSRFHRGLTDQQQRMWLDMAACFEVCETSGAPVAEVLERLAATREAEQDAAALRETALAGPRATVRLLNGLPFLGLGLGVLMGVDPFAVLLGEPQGWGLLAAGLALVFAGRVWSARMIAGAAQTATSCGNNRRSAGPRLKDATTAGRRG